MPKMKTNRGAAKRFKMSSSGKVIRRKAFTSHILTKKTRKRKRSLRRAQVADTSNMREIRRLLPNG